MYNNIVYYVYWNQVKGRLETILQRYVLIILRTMCIVQSVAGSSRDNSSKICTNNVHYVYLSQVVRPVKNLEIYVLILSTICTILYVLDMCVLHIHAESLHLGADNGSSCDN